MIIQTDRLLLRPLSLNDLYTTHQYVSDIENIKYMVYFPTNSLDETKEFVNKVADEWQKALPQFYEFAVTFESEHIGSYHVMQKLDLQLKDNTQERKNKNSITMSKELIYSLVIE